MIARLGWLALGVVVGVLGGRAAARRSEPAQAPPVLASATRVALGTTPAAGPTAPASGPTAPAAEPAEPAAPRDAPSGSEGTAPAARPSPAPRPTPTPRPRPEPSGRHAWVPPEESAPGGQPPPA